MSDNSIYATPRLVADINECGFYHTMDIPGYGVVKGSFDLREGVREYLGNVDFQGKRVLELGTASGFLCFHMESEGAEVVAYDLSENDLWDIVPFYNCDFEQCVAERKEAARKLNNAFWFCHGALNSNAKLVHGTVYTVPKEIGMVDISTFGAILLHVRDPFLALQNSLRLTKQTVIITSSYTDILSFVFLKLHVPYMLIGLREAFISAHMKFVPNLSAHMKFVPNPNKPGLAGDWWDLSPAILIKMIAVLGFEDVAVTYHWQRYSDNKIRMYTIVGHRTVEYYDY